MLKVDNSYFNKKYQTVIQSRRRRISYKPEPSFRAVGDESHTNLVRDISLSLNMTDNLHVIPYYDTESVNADYNPISELKSLNEGFID